MQESLDQWVTGKLVTFTACGASRNACCKDLVDSNLVHNLVHLVDT